LGQPPSGRFLEISLGIGSFQLPSILRVSGSGPGLRFGFCFRIVFEKRYHYLSYFIGAFRVWLLCVVCPRSPRMQRIPSRFHLAPTRFALIVMAEAINADIPNGLNFSISKDSPKEIHMSSTRR